MRLQVSQAPTNSHTAMVTAACWTPTNELFTAGDDNQLLRWGAEGDMMGVVCTLDTFATDMHWFPSIGKQAADTFALACTDGTFRLMSKAGREEHKVEAHHGAVIALRWNYDGSALATGGEDGAVRVWSRSGNLRSNIAATGKPVYTVSWGPDNDSLLFSSGGDLIVKAMEVGRKPIQWRAHRDGVVLQADWNAVNNLIVSGGEDCVYKVWDAFGRQLYQSQPFEYVITSVSWCPNGEYFVVGSFNILRLCDKTGWSYCREGPNAGSMMQIAWTPDGTQLAAAGGSGAVVFGQLVERYLQWNNVEVTLAEPKRIRVQDVLQEVVEDLVFPRDRVIEMSLGFGYLVVATATQCFIYSHENWNTPHIFDLRDSTNLIIQAERHFVIVDNFSGTTVYSYEGRQLSNPRFAGLRSQFLNRKTISLSNDTVAILDRSDSKAIRTFDVSTGRPLGTPVQHSNEIVELALSQYSESVGERKLVFIDRNRDLYITGVQNVSLVKLHTQVDSVAWNDVSDMLAVVADEQLVTWYYPNAVYVDRDLLAKTRVSKPTGEFRKLPQICNFYGSRVTVRRADGALLTSSVSPYPAMLYGFIASQRWNEAVRLCRYVKSPELWAMLAAAALYVRHLDTAEIALAAVQEVDKLHFVLYLKEIPSEEGRNAELALYRGDKDAAERILLQASPPLVYRAIKMNVRLFDWDRALDIAEQKRQHIDTVCAYRQRYLDGLGAQETLPRFLQHRETIGEIDWEAINARKAEEKGREAGSSSAASSLQESKGGDSKYDD